MNFKKKKKYRKINQFNEKKVITKYYIIFIAFFSSVFVSIYLYIYRYKKKFKNTQKDEVDEEKEYLNKIFNRSIEKDENEEYEAIKNFTELTRKGISFDKDKIYNLSKIQKYQ